MEGATPTPAFDPPPFPPPDHVKATALTPPSQPAAFTQPGQFPAIVPAPPSQPQPPRMSAPYSNMWPPVSSFTIPKASTPAPTQEEPKEPKEEPEPTPMNPKVKEVSEQFSLNEGLTQKLDEILKKRPDTFENDLEILKKGMESAPSAVAYLFTKIREMQDGRPLLAVPERDVVEELANRYRLDQRVMQELTAALANRADKKKDVEMLAKHCEMSHSPSAAVMSMVSLLRNGGEIPEHIERHDRPQVSTSDTTERKWTTTEVARPSSRDRRRSRSRDRRGNDRDNYRRGDRRDRRSRSRDRRSRSRDRRDRDRRDRRSRSRDRRSRDRRSRDRKSRDRRSRDRRSHSQDKNDVKEKKERKNNFSDGPVASAAAAFVPDPNAAVQMPAQPNAEMPVPVDPNAGMQGIHATEAPQERMHGFGEASAGVVEATTSGVTEVGGNEAEQPATSLQYNSSTAGQAIQENTGCTSSTWHQGAWEPSMEGQQEPWDGNDDLGVTGQCDAWDSNAAEATTAPMEGAWGAMPAGNSDYDSETWGQGASQVTHGATQDAWTGRNNVACGSESWEHSASQTTTGVVEGAWDGGAASAGPDSSWDVGQSQEAWSEAIPNSGAVAAGPEESWNGGQSQEAWSEATPNGAGGGDGSWAGAEADAQWVGHVAEQEVASADDMWSGVGPETSSWGGSAGAVPAMDEQSAWATQEWSANDGSQDVWLNAGAAADAWNAEGSW